MQGWDLFQQAIQKQTSKTMVNGNMKSLIGKYQKEKEPNKIKHGLDYFNCFDLCDSHIWPNDSSHYLLFEGHDANQTG